VADPSAEALARLQQQFGVTTALQADAVAAAADVIVLAVKPQAMRAVAASCCLAAGRA
jgi:pyrroline-5-carboxylate reductase